MCRADVEGPGAVWRRGLPGFASSGSFPYFIELNARSGLAK